ncbi:MAG: GTP-binding protein, partial [Prochlorococcus sp.]
MISKQRLLLSIACALAVLLVIGALLQVVRNLLWDLSYLLPAWLLGPVLLLAASLVIIFVIQVGWPWWKAFKRQSLGTAEKNQAPLSPPSSRHQAAKQSLESIDRLLERLQDDVAREGLTQERERVGKELARGDLIVVVFGTGSSGK